MAGAGGEHSAAPGCAREGIAGASTSAAALRANPTARSCSASRAASSGEAATRASSAARRSGASEPSASAANSARSRSSSSWSRVLFIDTPPRKVSLTTAVWGRPGRPAPKRHRCGGELSHLQGLLCGRNIPARADVACGGNTPAVPGVSNGTSNQSGRNPHHERAHHCPRPLHPRPGGERGRAGRRTGTELAAAPVAVGRGRRPASKPRHASPPGSTGCSRPGRAWRDGSATPIHCRRSPMPCRRSRPTRS